VDTAFSLEVKDGKTVPTGGFTRDGRVDTLAQQARLPLLAAHEMANGTAGEFAARLSRAAYAAQFRTVFGEHVFDDPERRLRAPPSHCSSSNWKIPRPSRRSPASTIFSCVERSR
jgi:cytochrome c peroxidase